MRRAHQKGAVQLVSCALFAMNAGGARAQHVEAVEPADALAEIVVKAQRRNEHLEDVPMSVTALTSAAIENAGVSNIHDLGQVVAGAQINFQGCCTQPAIRGITSLPTGLGFENNVAIYIDGFYSPDNITINQDFANIAQVEVLKGPQGALYGRNATGGAILITTKEPSHAWTGDVQSSYGRFQDGSLSTYLSGPISDRVRVSLSGSDHRSDGYINLIDPDAFGHSSANAAPLKQQSASAKIQADLLQDLTATLAYSYRYSDDARGDLFNTFQYVPATTPAPPLRATQPFTASYNHTTLNGGRTNDTTLTLRYNTAIGTLTSYTGYAARNIWLNFDYDGTYQDSLYFTQRFRDKTLQQSLDFNTTSIARTDLIVGATYYHDTLTDDGYQSFGAGNALQSTIVGGLGTQAYAAYVDATVSLSERLKLEVGGRENYEKKSVHNGVLAPNGTNLVPPAAADANFSAFTPRATLRYELVPRTSIYATYSRGFRSGAYNPFGTSTFQLAPIKPETVDAFELGFKTASPRLRLDIAAFYYDYSNLQVAVVVPSPSPPYSPISLTSNAPKARIYGADAELSTSVAQNLTVGAGLSLLHGRYADFSNASGTGLNTATSSNVLGQKQDWSGQQMARAPNYSGFANANYVVPLTNGNKLRLSANASFTDSYPLNPSLYGALAGTLANKQRYVQPSYWILNSEAVWTNSSGFSCGVFGNNLNDARYYVSFNGGPFGDYRVFSPPRTYGVKAGYSF